MRTRIVKHHYCDFCSKVKHTLPAIIKHEASCTMNPKRVCKMCAMAGCEQKDIAELIATQKGAAYSDYDFEGSRITPEISKEKELREITQGCPACIMSVIRQNKGPTIISFDWKEESKAWLSNFGKSYRDDHY